jgi:glycosyltransferase involved in cell wall biosynthesis
MGKGTISWFSNSPTATTGYGVQTAQVVKRLVKDEYNVAILSNYGREGVNGTWDSGYGIIPEYARGAEIYSQDVTPLNHQHHKAQYKDQADVLITLYDTWILKGKKYDQINLACWTPVDHYPCPPDVLAWLSKPNVTPIAMSKFGQKAIQDAGIECEYVPHAIEDVFTPTDTIDGKNNREYLGAKDTDFLVMMNAANKANGLVHRKALAENLLAFSIFAKDKPDAVIYLHMDMFGAFGGWNLPNLLEAVGLLHDQVILVDQIAYRYGLSQEVLAGLYTAADVYLGTSYGEGFGVGTIESQACSTPVIVSNFAASPELVGDGWVVDGQPLWDHHQRSWFNVPSVPGIVAALEEAYARPRGKSEKALEFAKDYRADVVYETHWKPVLKKLLK